MKQMKHILRIGAYLFALAGAGYIGYKFGLGRAEHEQCDCGTDCLCNSYKSDNTAIDILHVDEFVGEQHEDTENNARSAANKYWKEPGGECNKTAISSNVSQPEMERKSILDESGSSKSVVTNGGEIEHVVCYDKSLDDNNSVLEIESIKPKEFVQAVASGALMRSFVFNPQTKEFYWNFTEEGVDDKDAIDWFGQSIINEIIEESKFNANGWIQPRFLYNKTEDVYIKIETGTIIN